MHLELLKQNIVTLIWQKMSSLITTGTSNGGLDPNHLKSASESSFRWVLVWPLVESIVNMICGASKSIGNVEKVTIQKSELCQMKNIEQILFLIYWRARTFGETMSRKQTLFCPKIPNMQYTDTLNESYTYQRRKQFFVHIIRRTNCNFSGKLSLWLLLSMQWRRLRRVHPLQRADDHCHVFTHHRGQQNLWAGACAQN